MANLTNLTQEGVAPVTANVKPVVENDRAFDFGMAQAAIGAASGLYDMYLVDKMNKQFNEDIDDSKQQEFDDLRTEIAKVEAALDSEQKPAVFDMDEEASTVPLTQEDKIRLERLQLDLQKMQAAAAQGVISSGVQYETKMAQLAKEWKNRFPHLAPQINQAYAAGTGRNGSSYSKAQMKYDPVIQAMEAQAAQRDAFAEQNQGQTAMTHPHEFELWQAKVNRDNRTARYLASMTPTELLTQAKTEYKSLIGQSLIDRLVVKQKMINDAFERGEKASDIVEFELEAHKTLMGRAIDQLLVDNYGMSPWDKDYADMKKVLLEQVDQNVSLVRTALDSGKKLTDNAVDALRKRMFLENPQVNGGMVAPGMAGRVESGILQEASKLLASGNKERAGALLGVINETLEGMGQPLMTMADLEANVAAVFINKAGLGENFWEGSDGVKSRLSALADSYPPAIRNLLVVESAKAANNAPDVEPPVKESVKLDAYNELSKKNDPVDVINVMGKQFPGDPTMRGRGLQTIDTAVNPLFSLFKRTANATKKGVKDGSIGDVPLVSRVVRHADGIALLDSDGRLLERKDTEEFNRWWKGTVEADGTYYTDSYWKPAFDDFYNSLPDSVSVEEYDVPLRDIPGFSPDIPSVGDTDFGDMRVFMDDTGSIVYEPRFNRGEGENRSPFQELAP